MSKKTFDLGDITKFADMPVVSVDTETTPVDPLTVSTSVPSAPVLWATWTDVKDLIARQSAQSINWRMFYRYGGFSSGGAVIGAIGGQRWTVTEPQPTEDDMRRQRDVRCITESDSPLVPPGKVAFTRGEGTFNARLRLKALGGRWDANLLGGVWLLPADVIHEAAQAIRLAVKAGRELPADGAVDAQVEKITCYVCGERYTPWAFAALTGASVGEWYCGCEERRRGPAPRVATTRTR